MAPRGTQVPWVRSQRTRGGEEACEAYIATPRLWLVDWLSLHR